MHKSMRSALAVAVVAGAGPAPIPWTTAAEVREAVRPILSAALPNVPRKTVTAVLVAYRPGGNRRDIITPGVSWRLSSPARSARKIRQPVRRYQAGEAFFEPPGSEHLVSENASATEPATLVAVFVADDGAVLTIDDP